MYAISFTRTSHFLKHNNVEVDIASIRVVVLSENRVVRRPSKMSLLYSEAISSIHVLDVWNINLKFMFCMQNFSLDVAL